MATYQQTVQFIKKELDQHYPEGEINSFITIIFHQLEKLSGAFLHMKYPETIAENTVFEIGKIVQRLKKMEPIQYIFGETIFYGLNFKVNQNVLIPRPETEELVDWILNEKKNKCDLHVHDIGTGSGAIAIALAKKLCNAKVMGTDISKSAIKIAVENARLNQVHIKFRIKNILHEKRKKIKSKFDIIVSNPPYIAHKEKEKMSDNVLQYEPHIALFVEDDDPLLFYRVIAQYAKKALKPSGELFLEINENHGMEVFNLLLNEDFEEVTLQKDLNGKDRMIKAINVIL